MFAPTCTNERYSNTTKKKTRLIMCLRRNRQQGIPIAFFMFNDGKSLNPHKEAPAHNRNGIAPMRGCTHTQKKKKHNKGALRARRPDGSRVRITIHSDLLALPGCIAFSNAAERITKRRARHVLPGTILHEQRVVLKHHSTT